MLGRGEEIQQDIFRRRIPAQILDCLQSFQHLQCLSGILKLIQKISFCFIADGRNRPDKGLQITGLVLTGSGWDAADMERSVCGWTDFRYQLSELQKFYH